MNSDKNEAKKLPDGWVLCNSKSSPGRKYYFNKKTGKSLWTQPEVDEKAGAAKSKGKKEKKEKRREELQKKNLKRKSGGNESGTCKKKPKQVPETPDKRKLATPKKVVVVTQKSDNSKKKPPEKITKKETRPKLPNKNVANNRLSHLREQLTTEVQANKTEESPSKKPRISPNTPQIDISLLPKIPKLDLKSPPTEKTQNESKCSTTQSPSSDSIHSIPSPSQFLAANKIISSMKAQLPEEYDEKLKPKDTFADIEEGICSQTTEYPYMKHPATPPQFSEASKLVSAIKSKLAYRISPKDVTMKTFSSAKDRMESLRTRLSNEAIVDKSLIEKSLVEKNLVEITDEEYLSKIELPPEFLSKIELPPEAMDVEEVKQNISTAQSTRDMTESHENIVLVVDTNIFIHELGTIKNVLNSHIRGYTEQPTLLVPWRVINELDRLKDNNNGNAAICKPARSAMDYLYERLPENNRIKGQSLRDANSHIYPCESPDDEILNCCLQQAERGKSVILLSNDKNLCNKASINGVKCLGLDKLKPLLENKAQATSDPDVYASVKHYENTMHHLLANILENEMRAKYNNLWQHVVFVSPPWSLRDVVRCLLKHWVAVFHEVFPRIEHLFTDLSNVLADIATKDQNSLSQSTVKNFKELCLEIAKKCQIIPEYMELAKSTVEQLQKKCASETSSANTSSNSEMVVIDAFEGLWTVFSSYCAKLCAILGIPNNLEDKIPSNDTLTILTNKWSVFSGQLRELGFAMKGYLTSESGREEDNISQLEAVFRKSLSLVNLDHSKINKDNMRIFCTNCRNMLLEAQAKFAELVDLLDACRNNISSNV